MPPASRRPAVGAGLEAAVPDAAAPGWPNLAIWSMPPIAYALASDTLTASCAPARPPLPRKPGGRRPAASPYPAGVPRPGKTARFLDLVTERNGPLASIPLDRVAGIAADLAPASA